MPKPARHASAPPGFRGSVGTEPFATLGQAADRIVRIPGTMNLHRLQEKLRTVNLELTPGDPRDIGSALTTIPIQSGRYSEKPPADDRPARGAPSGRAEEEDGAAALRAALLPRIPRHA